MTKLYGSLEAGGTKFVCAVGDENNNVIEKTQFPTTTQLKPLINVLSFFSKFESLAGLAIGSFGPIDIDKNSKTYGFITTTPKPHWGKCRCGRGFPSCIKCTDLLYNGRK